MMEDWVLGLCAWDLPALLLAAVMVMLLVVHVRGYRKRRRVLEQQLNDAHSLQDEEAAALQQPHEMSEL